MSLKNWLGSGLKTPNYISGALVAAGIIGMIINVVMWGTAAVSNDITPILALISGSGVALFMVSQAMK